MTPTDIFSYAGTAASVTAAFVMVRASWQINSAEVWRGEAEAQKTRADRLQDDLSEIKERLTRIEAENRRLVELITTLDPTRIRSDI
ncbi:putative nuclease with TOPRIM domain [Kitasatospora sp. MAA19]|uniref:hypothetical protein n=1 Tax=Kitasatospora sp. MAA19 TaxID=3035090 RepID=UPI002475C8BA|nr:hypothetical protein [Kitasatospora sp. MAA19]MDH6705413.1 putative nuclease with TOPRIM domain [Kitasatospora sp. MAA19]